MKFTKNRLITAAIIAAAIIAFAYFYFSGRRGPNPQTAKAERRDIIQLVSATGNVKPTESVNLAFKTGGLILKVYADVGDKVYASEPLVALNASELNAQLNKAEANLSTQEAALAKANIDLDNYYADVQNTVNSAYTSANDAIRIKTDSLFSNDESNGPQMTFTSNNTQEKTDAEYQRIIMRDMLNGWLVQINALNQNTPPNQLEQGLTLAATNLNSSRRFLDLLFDTVVNATALNSSTTSAYESSVNNARSEIDSALASVNALSQNISAQKATVNSDQASQKSYEADIANIKAQLSQTVIHSPIAGVVTKQNAKVGEVAAPNAVLTSVISDSKFEIDSNIPEVDIAKIKVGGQARVTLDAYGNDVVFDTVITSVDPAETIIEGVATYLTKLQFVKFDDRIKPGLTANIDIVSGKRENALAVPQRAIRRSGQKDFVALYKGGNQPTRNAEVTLGLKGSDGYVEILSGISEGDEVVTSKPTP